MAELPDGDQRHLAPGSIRWSLARQMRLVAAMTADATGQVPGQYAALLAGVPVVLSRGDVAGFVPQDRQPANLAEHDLWVLRGDHELTPR